MSIVLFCVGLYIAIKDHPIAGTYICICAFVL